MAVNRLLLTALLLWPACPVAAQSDGRADEERALRAMLGTGAAAGPLFRELASLYRKPIDLVKLRSIADEWVITQGDNPDAAALVAEAHLRQASLAEDQPEAALAEVNLGLAALDHVLAAHGTASASPIDAPAFVVGEGRACDDCRRVCKMARRSSGAQHAAARPSWTCESCDRFRCWTTQRFRPSVSGNTIRWRWMAGR